MDISVDSSSCYSKGKDPTSHSIALGSGTKLQGGGCLEGGLCIALWELGNIRQSAGACLLAADVAPSLFRGIWAP